MARPTESQSLPNQMLSHLFNLKLADPGGDFHGALSAWFSMGNTPDIEKWKNVYPVKGEIDQANVHEMISQHHQWCMDNQIKATPTIFINGKQLPVEFSINDLKFQIRRMVEQIPVGEPEPVF
jgi:hypothetical protein